MKKISKTDWKKIDTMRDADIDTTDIPPLGASFFKNAIIRMPQIKDSVTIRLDHAILGWFKRRGRGYQTLINAVLKTYVESQQKAQKRSVLQHR